MLLILPIFTFILVTFFRQYNTLVLLLFLLATSSLFVLFTLKFNLKNDLLLFLLWFMCLLLSISDYYHYLVDPKILYSFSLISLSVFFKNQLFSWQLFFVPSLLFLLFFVLDKLLPDSFGGGDVKLLMILAFFLSAQQILFIILIASFTGIIFLLIFNFLCKNTLKHLPFVPFITFALIIVTIY